MSSAQASNSTAYDTSSIAQGGAQNALIGGLAAMGLYGVFVVLFCITLHILFFRRKRHLNRILLTAAISIFIFTTMDIIIECHRLLVGLLYTPAALSDAYFNSGGDWQFGLQDTARIVVVLIADAVLIYRVYCVWERRWYLIVFNILCWLGTLVSSIRILQLQIEWIEQPSAYYYLADMTKYSLATQSLTVAQTTTATGLIAFRLWQVDRGSAAYKESSLLPVARIMVESGMLYTALMLCNVATTALQNPGLFVILTLMSPVIGITFSLIIVRVGLGLSSESRSTQRSTGMTTTTPHSINISVRRRQASGGHGEEEEGGTDWDGGESVGLEMMSKSAASSEAVTD
ncbi:hypothetical protein CALVIDRAFT_595949 [Calocera viscosa TUFC12733]|uniref:Uncharacterized protein n=1 Tax=Calocera viscosa (strain TUFC12733) TaxID=1330018 RepID=A0A167Q1X1_CALVF|nr:hypothetical protein CALVIDRAFT_595949 [Calocera viscosa TUFC12733]